MKDLGRVTLKEEAEGHGEADTIIIQETETMINHGEEITDKM